MTPDPRKVAILISGRGSNMRALVEKAEGYEVTLVASNRPSAPGLAWAEERGIETWSEDSRGQDRADFDKRLGDRLEESGAGTIALAGFMRILGPDFIRRFEGRMLNIHPSLLPKYKGLDTHARALEAGDAEHGCSVHVVTEELDAGEVVAQARVPVTDSDTIGTLEAKVLIEEHKLYPQALARFAAR
ncbi:phosphoribosylglycinamide formyltransferase [Sphingomicrobium aestuariivivum]|uniref:phosphoribosylglycinamide formyltransferase n=1 Tax=Sphingomicrobium aestuariivivum TaxID=1582356 RepID=UPI001FD71006|nr:phosphoribosylglycinamide formyltransferase [Sphingomicrobium aestuariivivum]MCJ8190029.1 phosphoribosylglycinamide formyltransferase [Sphingomicrobium aestuariivivum]